MGPIKRIVLLALFIHVALCFLALSANLAPSELQRDLLWMTRSYLRPLNLELGFVPIELTHNYQQVEGPFRMRCQFDGQATDQWTDVDKYFQPRTEQLRFQRCCRELNALMLEERSDVATDWIIQIVHVINRATTRPVARVLLERELRFGRSEFNSPEFQLAANEEKVVVLFDAQVVEIDGEPSLIAISDDSRTSKSRTK